jgi:acyl-CoA thioesterase-1
LRETGGIRDTRAMRRLMIAGLVAIAAALVVGCGGRPRVAPLPAGTTILALGDSLTYGTGATPETSYPAFLAETTGWAIVNGGIPGDTAQQGCDRMPALVAQHRPALILMFLGGNDILRRRPASALTEGLAECVRSAKANGIPLVLLAVPTFGITGFDDAPLFAKFAEAQEVPWFSPGLGKLLRDDTLRADAIHLNADGYRALAANVARELRRMGYLAQ